MLGSASKQGMYEALDRQPSTGEGKERKEEGEDAEGTPNSPNGLGLDPD